ncbi:flagellar biosynthetic protein FliP [Granulicella aggregans]|uniref:Flagellar biosynthetic protein FliP n=1 Tax=Granulicella aggregans TaxID=474949 RepID=A0A7W7ZDJ9_9BACT|nr:flagellar type III secretion system pore protein FliP [Granulicella aggregans]MBB5057629.1 flagellar biosynthetic protein FliP [Granulicella aggregans]
MMAQPHQECNKKRCGRACHPVLAALVLGAMFVMPMSASASPVRIASFGVGGGVPLFAAAETKPSAANHGPAGSLRNGSNPGTDSLGNAMSKSIADQMKGNQSVPWAIVFGLTLLTLLPAILLSMTPMIRLLVVFHFLRQALGTQTAPSNQVLMGLALMMTWFLMQPVLLQVEQQAVTPYRENRMTGEAAIAQGLVPVKQYMLRYAREKDLMVFASAGMGTQPRTRDDLPLPVIFPAYILSELKAGFQIGAVLFLPFLLVDLMVASVTTSIGMMQLPPVVISTPLKILLFVMVDGWNLLADQLLKSF